MTDLQKQVRVYLYPITATAPAACYDPQPVAAGTWVLQKDLLYGGNEVPVHWPDGTVRQIDRRNVRRQPLDDPPVKRAAHRSHKPLSVDDGEQEVPLW